MVKLKAVILLQQVEELVCWRTESPLIERYEWQHVYVYLYGERKVL
jgi:hypothetical protein